MTVERTRRNYNTVYIKLQRRVFTRLLTVLTLTLCTLHAHASPDKQNKHKAAHNGQPPREKLLIFDVDNTLYREDRLQLGVEHQIVKNIHQYGQERYNIDAKHADQLHYTYGSTIEGIRQTILHKSHSQEQVSMAMQDFYETVYKDIDMSSLLSGSAQQSSSTGYTHKSAYTSQHLRALANGRRRWANSGMREKWIVASNSPVNHVHKVIQALGLARVFGSSEIVTPNVDKWTRSIDYPTKLSRAYYEGWLPMDASDVSISLLDDSVAVMQFLQKHKDIPIRGYLVSAQEPLTTALARAMGWIQDDYQFDAVEYIKCKNLVDYESINRPTWSVFCDRLCQMAARIPASSPVCIVDLGAGLLSFLRLVLHGYKDMPSLVSMLAQAYHALGSHVSGESQKRNNDSRSSFSFTKVDETRIADNIESDAGLLPGSMSLHYVAYEPNRALESTCLEVMAELGFTMQQTFHWDDPSSGTADLVEHVFVASIDNGSQDAMSVTVSIRFWDYTMEPNISTNSVPTPHAIVGCCFADLVQPHDLVSSLLRCFLSSTETAKTDMLDSKSEKEPVDSYNALLYFPITFAGVTQFVPAKPVCKQNGIPSDTIAFRTYSQSLQADHHHSLQPEDLVDAVRDYGGELITQGPSDWIIDPKEHNELWQTMMYFFGSVASTRLHAAGWNGAGWLQRAWQYQPVIAVSNRDLLFNIPRLGHWKAANMLETASSIDSTYEEIQFVAPNDVTTVTKQVPALAPNDVLIESVCSLISSGTELKIYQGLFDDAALDVNIDSMQDARMAYPLAYGYSLVGRVVGCGDGVVDRSNLLGKLVFTFSAHATMAVADRQAIHIVPDGIDALDAIFMPSVETALSIVHDAHPRLGENVAVYGQGLIGLLVTAVLSRAGGYSNQDGRVGSITTFDTLTSRLAVSTAMGSHQALFPQEAVNAGPFDLSIEVSGNGRALQSAIDMVRSGGRVIIASWYGNRDLSLKLGIDFHRSHKTIITSQVSEIPASLSSLWSKQRRFDLTWELLREIRPSLLLTRLESLQDAKTAYDALGDGKELAIAFDYSKQK
jgi:NADPH:quinone reductase-like Zn-dependent oxidoreductase/FMN phosphatase YigB (HAD superfamily)